MADDKTPAPCPTLTPYGIGPWVIVQNRLMEPAQPTSHLPQRLVTVRPSRPGTLAPDTFTRKVGDNISTLLIEAQRQRSPVEAPVPQMGQKALRRRRPQAGHPPDRSVDEGGSTVEPALQPKLCHTRQPVRADQGRPPREPSALPVVGPPR